ncbi:MAG: cytochrome c maturation protein CcmE [Candidatus Marinimicrobia bacterium]|jgi:cytochrome c-type biogenesis protein CcmE|nr:cytochrome c maturation protein CcmE [Candidatus Neomarinimicrobiota bacterium]
MPSGKRKFSIVIFGISCVILFWVYWVSSGKIGNQSGLIQFLSIAELTTHPVSEKIKLGGLVKEGSIQISEENKLNVEFHLKEGENNLPVHYSGIRPDLFKDEAEVIVTGNYINGVFRAENLQTKCASRYEGDLRTERSYNLKEL